MILGDRYCYPHFTDDETQVLKDELNFPRSYSKASVRHLVQTQVSDSKVLVLVDYILVYYIHQFKIAGWLKLVGVARSEAEIIRRG